MPYFNVFELEFENNTVIFEISTLKFVYLQHFEKKQKYLQLGPKMSYFSIFRLEFENNIVVLEISNVEFA